MKILKGKLYLHELYSKEKNITFRKLSKTCNIWKILYFYQNKSDLISK